MSFRRSRALRPLSLALTGLLCGCMGESMMGAAQPGVSGGDSSSPDVPTAVLDGTLVPPPAGLRLLTVSQYQNAMSALLGPTAVAPKIGTWNSSLAAAQGGVSARTVEDYEQASLELAAAVFADETGRMDLVGCDPAGLVTDAQDACAQTFFERFGRRAWRRPLSAEERSRYAAVAAQAASVLQSGWRGLELAAVGLLQSPNFLYRAEFGEPIEGSPVRKLSSWELASRISFLLWNAPPDDLLLDAAERGELETEEGLRAQVQRLLNAPEGRAAVEHFFTDLLDLDALEEIEKDANLFPSFTQELARSMHRQVSLTVVDHLRDRQGDFRELFDTRTTFVDSLLATHYGVSLPEGASGFERIELPESARRAGLLGLGGVLALNATPVATSATLRGKFVRDIFLCQDIPPPPPEVDTTLPPLTDGSVTTARDRLAAHRENASCVSCHLAMDPIGLTLENFDASGAFRTQENGLTIDASGELDGTRFQDSLGLGTALRNHPKVGRCVVQKLYRYATGTIESPKQTPVIDELTADFTEAQFRFVPLIEELAMHPLLRFAGPTQD